jgi:5-formyltetrahydrofolate cyclo-ligase
VAPSCSFPSMGTFRFVTENSMYDDVDTEGGRADAGRPADGPDRTVLAERKKTLRSRLMKRRAQAPEEDRLRASEAIRARVLGLPEVLGARSAFIFISHGSEVDTHPLIDELLGRGLALSVPRVVDAHQMAAVPFPGWDGLVPGTLGIPAPSSTEPVREAPDVVITPGLAFTLSGDRLGYGRGYYDRWFHQNPSPVRIAVAFDLQLVEHLPVHDRDVPVDLIVTEARVVRTGRRDLEGP